MTNSLTTHKFAVTDAHELDQRIPKNLMISMEGKPFVLKAGLEWKANQLFGLGNWSLKTEIVDFDRKEPYALVKATVVFQGQSYENFGEASIQNVANKNMHKYMLHMAITRAEARALRVATACGFTAVEELDQVKAEHIKVAQTVTTEPIESQPDEEPWLNNLTCSECDAAITEKVAQYSNDKYGRLLCFDCQKQEQKLTASA